MLLRPKLCLISYLSGGFFPTRKDIDVSVCDLSIKFPDFMQVKYDACFFGPLSSEIQKTVDESIDIGYFDENLVVMESEPIDRSRKLTDEGKWLGKKICSDPFLLEGMGLTEEQIPHLSASILSNITLPKSFSVAYGLFLDRIRKDPKLKRVHDEEKTPVKDILSIKPDEETFEKTFNKLINIYNDTWNWIISVDKLKRDDGGFAIPYGIVPEHIGSRYSYLQPDLEKISEKLSEAQKAQEKQKENNFLFDMIKNRIGYMDIAEGSDTNIKSLIDEYPDIPRLYVEEVVDKLETLEKSYEKIEKEGYTHLLQILTRLAKSSLDVKDNTELEERLHTKVGLNNGGSVFSTYVPDSIKKKFGADEIGEGTWNYGMTYHSDHFIQTEPNTLLVYKKHEDYVKAVGMKPSTIDS